MTELPAGDPHEVIHLGDEAAVVVPLAEYRQLRHDARRTRLIEQADTEEAAALRITRIPLARSRTAAMINCAFVSAVIGFSTR